MVDEADRCFILTGAYSLSGPKNVDWAVPAAQRATEKALNEYHALDNTHPLVKHVMYLDALDSSQQPWINDPNRPPVLIDPPSDASTSRGTRISTSWTWVVVGAAFTILLTIFTLWYRRCRRRRGGYYDESTPGCRPRRRRGHHHPERITRGYLAYPSPDRSYDSRPRTSLWMAENPAIPNDVSPDLLSDPPMSWSEINEEPVLSFDPVLGPPLSSSQEYPPQQRLNPPNLNHSQGEPNETVVWHDGSFPTFSTDSSGAPPPVESVIHDDDDNYDDNYDKDQPQLFEFGAVSFYDDDDDDEESAKWRRPASPDAEWVRDLV